MATIKEAQNPDLWLAVRLNLDESIPSRKHRHTYCTYALTGKDRRDAEKITSRSIAFDPGDGF